jgi:hypothetical protein
LDKWEEGRGFGQKALLLPPSLTTQTQETGRPTVEGGRGVSDLVHDDDREVGRNKEEIEGNRFRSLPRAGVLRRGGSTAAGGDRLWWSVVAVLGCLGGREAWLGWCVARWGAGPALL